MIGEVSCMKKIYYPAVFHPEEEGGFSVSVPDIEGCFTQGETIAEAVEMAQDAIGLMLEDCSVWPEASSPAGIACEPGEFVVMVQFDALAYRRKHDNRAVKKTLTIPSWLNELAIENNINFSGVLQDALKEKLGLA